MHTVVHNFIKVMWIHDKGEVLFYQHCINSLLLSTSHFNTTPKLVL